MVELLGVKINGGNDPDYEQDHREKIHNGNHFKRRGSSSKPTIFVTGFFLNFARGKTSTNPDSDKLWSWAFCFCYITRMFSKPSFLIFGGSLLEMFGGILGIDWVPFTLLQYLDSKATKTVILSSKFPWFFFSRLKNHRNFVGSGDPPDMHSQFGPPCFPKPSFYNSNSRANSLPEGWKRFHFFDTSIFSHLGTFSVNSRLYTSSHNHGSHGCISSRIVTFQNIPSFSTEPWLWEYSSIAFLDHFPIVGMKIKTYLKPPPRQENVLNFEAHRISRVIVKNRVAGNMASAGNFGPRSENRNAIVFLEGWKWHSSWWFQHFEKYESNWKYSPIFGVKIKNISNHHPA